MSTHPAADGPWPGDQPPLAFGHPTIGDWHENRSQARNPGFFLRRLTTAVDFDHAVQLQQQVWGESFSEVVPAGVLKVVQFVGGVAAGAFTNDGEMVGLVFGVSGIRDGILSHWSDTLAVRPAFQNRGLGEDLKWYQRYLLLSLQVEKMFWTFDPLESRNAYLNFARLGVVSGEYRRDFYGSTHSKLHDVIGTDRLVASWSIGSDRVVRRLAGQRDVIDASAIEQIPPINHVIHGAAGPRSGPADMGMDAAAVRLTIPADIQAMKERSLDLAKEWRQVTRTAFEGYMARGYEVRELIRDVGLSHYLLRRDPAR